MRTVLKLKFGKSGNSAVNERTVPYGKRVLPMLIRALIPAVKYK